MKPSRGQAPIQQAYSLQQKPVVLASAPGPGRGLLLFLDFFNVY
jgi:hypothetical protein